MDLGGLTGRRGDADSWGFSVAPYDRTATDKHGRGTLGDECANSAHRARRHNGEQESKRSENPHAPCSYPEAKLTLIN